MKITQHKFLRDAPTIALSMLIMAATLGGGSAFAQTGAANPSLAAPIKNVNNLMCQGLNFVTGPLGIIATVGGIVIAGVMIALGSRNGTGALMKSVAGAVVIGLAVPLASVGIAASGTTVNACKSVT